MRKSVRLYHVISVLALLGCMFIPSAAQAYFPPLMSSQNEFWYGKTLWARGSILDPQPGSVDVYICTVEGCEVLSSPHDAPETGRVALRIERTLAGQPAKTLKLPYWCFNNSVTVFDEGQRASAQWPPFLASLKKDDLILCSVDRTRKDEAHKLDGVAADAIKLSDSDDPLIDQFRQIIKLRDAKSIDELKARCRHLLEAQAGFYTLQACPYAALDRIAPKDPEAAMELLILRLQVPQTISDGELTRDLKFVCDQMEKLPRNTATHRQELADCLIPLLTALPESSPIVPWPGAPRIHSPTPDILHALARVVNWDQKQWPEIGPLRRAALPAALDALRPDQKDGAQADISTIKQWLESAGNWSGRQ